jgi:spore maturation protein CgeB
MKLDIVVLGLSITSSWGNGHATTYRALAKGLAARGHKVTFLERDVAWYRRHRDLRHPPFCRTELYQTLKELPRRYGALVRAADLVVLGSFVPDGAAIAEWITAQARGLTAFYDIDTPVTLARLEKGCADYINAPVIPRFDLYLSFTGGPALAHIEAAYGAQAARALYCAVDPDLHKPQDVVPPLALGYVGTYSPDRQSALDRLLLEPARRLPKMLFAVAGPQYPADIEWPPTSTPASIPANATRSTSRAPTWWRPAFRRACACSRRRRAACRSSPTAGRASRSSLRPARKFFSPTAPRRW